MADGPPSQVDVPLGHVHVVTGEAHLQPPGEVVVRTEQGAAEHRIFLSPEVSVDILVDQEAGAVVSNRALDEGHGLADVLVAAEDGAQEAIRVSAIVTST